MIQRKSGVKNFKSNANPLSPFPKKPTVEDDPYPFPNVRYPCQCSEQHNIRQCVQIILEISGPLFQSKGLFGMMYQLSTVPKRHVVPLKILRAKQCNGPNIVKAICVRFRTILPLELFFGGGDGVLKANVCFFGFLGGGVGVAGADGGGVVVLLLRVAAVPCVVLLELLLASDAWRCRECTISKSPCVLPTDKIRRRSSGS